VLYSSELLDALPALSTSKWEGTVFRHTFGSVPPEKENQLGARWNPAEVPAIYCSLQRETAIAEVEFHISLQPFRPTTERRVHRIQVRVPDVIELTDWQILERLGVSRASFEALEPPPARKLAELQLSWATVEFLFHLRVVLE
jgi:RES domain-containing protein